MKVAVLVESINVNDSSGSKVNVELIRNLAKICEKITVYHYTLKDIQLEGIECIFINERIFSFNYLLSRFQRYFTKFTGINMHQFLENLFGFSFTFFNDTLSIRAVLPEVAAKNYDLVLTLSKGASFRPHYAVLKFPQLHHKWMAYIHDPYPFHFYPRPFTKILPGYRQKEAFFRDLASSAKYVGFPSKLLSEWMSSFFPEMESKSIIIPHQISSDEINESFQVEGWSSQNFNILHAGNLLKERPADGLILAFENFLVLNRDAKSHARLFLIGPAQSHEVKLKAFDSRIPELTVILDFIKFEQALYLQREATVNVILESKSEISPFLPGKFPHCVFADKPILLLSPLYSETRRLLGLNYPYVAESDDIQKLTGILTDLYAEWIQTKNLTLNRPDLRDYLGIPNLQKVLTSIS